MKIRPILYSAPMVITNLNGTKTQTRREIKKQPPDWGMEINNASRDWNWIFKGYPKDSDIDIWTFGKCPYGEANDILWVRESFNIEHCPLPPEGDTDGTFYFYKATEKEYIDMKWKPSIHMPKPACRLFNKIVNIRVQRLHDISEEDAIAEGVIKDVELPVANFQTKMLYRDYTKRTAGCEDARSSFMTLWISINGQESWDRNPWVWAIYFEKTDKPENFLL